MLSNNDIHPKKIIVVNQRYHLKGGAAKYALYVAEALETNHHDVIPFSGQHPDNLDHAYADYAPQVLFPELVGSISTWQKVKTTLEFPFSPQSAQKLNQLIIDTQPDLIHYHNVFRQLSPAVLEVAHTHQIPSVWSLHDYNLFCMNGFMYRDQDRNCDLCYGHQYHQGIIHRCYRDNLIGSALFALSQTITHWRKSYQHVDVFAVPHPDMKQKLVEWGLPEQKIALIHNPYLLPEHPPVKTASPPYCVYFSAYDQSKGIFTLLDAMQTVRGIKLLLCGFGDGLASVQAYIQQHQLEEQVEIITDVSWDNGLPEIVAQALFAVNPSEGSAIFEYVGLDAFAMGTPLIASRNGGNKYLVEDNRTGLLFEIANPADLARKMQYMVDHPEHALQMGDNARQYMEAHYTQEQFYQNLIGLYKQAIINHHEKKEV